MFDVGFAELLVIIVVALVVVGPERLPGVARTVGALLGRAQRYINQVKEDVQREVDMEEFEKIRSSFYDAAKEVKAEVAGVDISANVNVHSAEYTGAEIGAQIK